MTTFEVLNWRDLRPCDRQAWTTFRHCQPSLRSPYFDLGWLDAVDSARGDLKVLRGTRGGAGVAFLPFHPGLLGAARPAGANFGDWHGFVAAPGEVIDAATAFVAGPATFRFDAAPATDPAFSACTHASGGSHGVDLSLGFELYARPASGAAPKAISNLRRGMRKLEADGLEPCFVFDDQDPATLRALMEWKSAQYRRSGHADALSWAWSRRLIDALLQGSTDDFGVRLSSLRIGGRLAAAHLGLRSGGAMHHWLPAYDPEFQKYAPGNLLTHEIAREGAGRGVVEIDFGPGDYTWKAEFANRRNPLISGVAHAASVQGRINATAYGLERRWSRLPLGAAAGLPHRLAKRIVRETAPFAPAPQRDSSAGAAGYPAE
jgi:CelD/BcsL family acetyltransferase involved in cellulose biosynthesis